MSEYAAPPGEPPNDQSLLRMFNELPDVVIAVDAEGRVLWGNRAAERLFGRSIQNAIGISGLALVHPEDLEFVMLSLTSIQNKQVGTPIEIRLDTQLGWRLVELIGAPVPWLEDGALLLSFRDLTDRRRYELAYNRDSRFRTLLQNAAVVTMLVSSTGVVQSCSGALTRMLGHDPELVEGRPLVELVAANDRSAVENALERASRGAAAASPVVVTAGLIRKGNEEPVPFELSLVNLVDDPTIQGFVVSGHDVTDRRQLEEQLSYQAFHDSLTGLGNRALFEDRLAHALQRAERVQGQLAVLFLDVDNLKSVNDERGHDVGDSLLHTIGTTLTGCIRKSDTAARLGGDEFAVIVEEFTDPGDILILADRILQACRQPITVREDHIRPTVSLGSTFSKVGMTANEILSKADRAMYVAKDRGKDRYEPFEDWMLVPK